MEEAVHKAIAKNDMHLVYAISKVYYEHHHESLTVRNLIFYCIAL